MFRHKCLKRTINISRSVNFDKHFLHVNAKTGEFIFLLLILGLIRLLEFRNIFFPTSSVEQFLNGFFLLSHQVKRSQRSKSPKYNSCWRRNNVCILKSRVF